MRTNKYGVSDKSKRTFYGIVFDSTKEMHCYIGLVDDQTRGLIKDLKYQVPFTLQQGYVGLNGKKVRPIVYNADFTFFDKRTNKYRVLDCKGFRTEIYRIKKKLFDFIMKDRGITLEEV